MAAGVVRGPYWDRRYEALSGGSDRRRERSALAYHYGATAPLPWHEERLLLEELSERLREDSARVALAVAWGVRLGFAEKVDLPSIFDPEEPDDEEPEQMSLADLQKLGITATRVGA